MSRKIDTAFGRMPLWKWILTFVSAFLFFILFYGIAQVFQNVSQRTGVNCAVLVISAGVLVLLYGCFTKLSEKEWFKTISGTGSARSLGMGFLTGVLYFVVVTGIMWITGIYKVESVEFDYAGLLLYLSIFLVVAVGEEIIFRGVIFKMIDERWSTWLALLVSALLFGLVHLSNQGATLWSSIAIAIEAGLMLGAAYKASGSLWFPIGIHWAWNYFEGPVFGFMVSGNDSCTPLFSPVISGPEFLTGGAFGAEASIIAAAVGLAFSLLFVRRMLSKK